MDGDPNTGMLVGETQTFPDGTSKYGEYRIGGTSLSSPLFAGHEALADQARGSTTASSTRRSTSWPGAMRSATSCPLGRHVSVVRARLRQRCRQKDGTSVTLRTADMDTSLHTKKGYDDVTGLGAPRGAHLLKALRHR